MTTILINNPNNQSLNNATINTKQSLNSSNNNNNILIQSQRNNNNNSSTTNNNTVYSIPSNNNNNNNNTNTSNNNTINIDALDLFKTELNSTDYAVQVHSPLKLGIVALSIGVQRSCDELFPYIYEYIQTCENDELLYNIGFILQYSGELLNNDINYIRDSNVLTILEHLCSEEESCIRDVSVDSINAISKSFDKTELILCLLPLIKRLSSSEWWTSRYSSVCLIIYNYNNMTTSVQNELRVIYNQLANDDTPMIRKKCYEKLYDYAIQLNEQNRNTGIYNILNNIINDELDSNRMYAIDNISKLINHVTINEIEQNNYLDLIHKLTIDLSWRVRMYICNKYNDITNYLNKNFNEVHAVKLLTYYSKLCTDNEPEVRNAAVKNLYNVCNNIKVNLIDIINQHILNNLCNDNIQQIRISLSESIVQLSTLYGRDGTQRVLLPLIQTLCHDECYEVRYNIFNNIEPLCDILGSASVVSQILPAFIELSKDNKWRVRYSIINNCYYLTKLLGEKIFIKRIQPMLINGLNDHVYAIREISCIQIGHIVGLYGDIWARDKLFLNIFSIFNTQINYLHRITCLLIISHIIKYCSIDTINTHLLPILIQATQDDVPNVKISAAKTLILFIDRYDNNDVKQKIIPLLNNMINDSDIDVQQYTQKTLDVANNKIKNTNNELNSVTNTNSNNNILPAKDRDSIEHITQQTANIHIT